MNKFAHRFAIGLWLSTLFLIFVGGLVKTTDSGLAVPDWPLSYGQLMPPMVGGIFYEHGHRMVATLVGFMTILLAIFITKSDERVWLKKTAWAAVALVIFQGVLGGVTVLLRLPKLVSIAHAFSAQTFFCLVTCLMVWTSRFWISTNVVRAEPPNKIPLHRLTLGLLVVSFIQLLLGATLRHTGRALPFHIGGAAAVAVLTLWVFRRGFWNSSHPGYMKRLVSGVLATMVAQLLLGATTYYVLIHPFDVIPIPFPAIVAITAHVALGAFFLGLTVLFFLQTFRTKPKNNSSFKSTMADYFTLTKPGISFMAGITALAGFVLGSAGDVNLGKLLHTCFGTLMAAAGAGCLNMLLEKETDARMARTQTRPLPSGRFQNGEVLFLGTLFSIGSVLYLAWTVNFLCAIIGALTLSVYLYIYTPLKKVSAICVTVGAVSGALPPVMGWTAATGHLSVGGWSLFGILFFWQFPHFLSLAWLYKEDYAKAGLHMLPDVPMGDKLTGQSVIINSFLLLGVSLMPFFLGLTGIFYFGTALFFGVAMIVFALLFNQHMTRFHAKRLFFFSLLYIPVLVVMMILNGPVPLSGWSL